MKILVRRIYDPPEKRNGLRILVDRLWPRGLKREKLVIHEWLKDVAPSDGVRKWFSHDPKKWQEFKRRYLKELKEKDELIQKIIEKAGNRTVAFF